MKRFPPWLIFVLVIVVLIAVKFIFFRKNDEAKPGQQGKPGMAVPVNYYVVRSDTFNSEVTSTGMIGAFNSVDVLPEVNGKITGIYFGEGEKVKKGELLVKLYDADLQAQLNKVKSQIKLSEQKLSRIRKLLEMKGVSQEEVEVQENELSALKADEAYIAAQLSKTNITAPFDGVAGLKNFSEGSFVTPGKPIVSIVQMSPLYVEFSLPERYFSLLKKGSIINFSAGQSAPSANSGQIASRSTATVFAIEPKVDEMTRTIRARAKFESGDYYPGSYVNVRVGLGMLKDALFVPTQAVVPTLKGQKVYVTRAGQVSEVQVKTGLRTENKIQVTDGLVMNDTVLTTGLLSLKKDSKVKLTSQVR
jgi:membrane fusion protein, multidrug efflux system